MIPDSTVTPIRILDAYTQPRRLTPGCQHQLGCKCDPPYWLRPSTGVEFYHEERYRNLFRVESPTT